MQKGQQENILEIGREVVNLVATETGFAPGGYTGNFHGMGYLLKAKKKKTITQTALCNEKEACAILGWSSPLVFLFSI